LQTLPSQGLELTPDLSANLPRGEVIDLVTRLSAFRTLPLAYLRATVAQIPLLRGEFMQLIQGLETCFQTPKPFYQSRPDYLTAAVEHHLANHERLFAKEWEASHSPALT
jgi:hypothetical protein